MRVIQITGLSLLLIIAFACAHQQQDLVKEKSIVMDTLPDWSKKLTPIQFHVTQEAGTERPFTGEYWDLFEKGTYHCICCGNYLFTSDTKFNSSCGWPSFFDALNEDAIEIKKDFSHGMIRDEVRCKKCGAHLGHVFEDGPKPTGLRYCINSAALEFKPADSNPEPSAQ